MGPHQNEVIGQDQDENIMESGQDLNRIITSCSRWCSRCRWCRRCRRCRRGKRSVGWKTRACTMQKEYIDQEQDTRTMESGQNLNRKDKGFPGHSDTRKSIFKGIVHNFFIDTRSLAPPYEVPAAAIRGPMWRRHTRSL